MQRKSSGYLTVEATISLSVFLFFMMFIMNFAQIYQVQNYVNHGLLESGKMLAFNSFEYDKKTVIDELYHIVQRLGILGEKHQSMEELERLWTSGQYGSAVSKAFGYYASDGTGITNENLKLLGVKEGISGLNFEGTTVTDDNLIINVAYEVDLPYKFFTFDKITLHQRVVCGLWK